MQTRITPNRDTFHAVKFIKELHVNDQLHEKYTVVRNDNVIIIIAEVYIFTKNIKQTNNIKL